MKPRIIVCGLGRTGYKIFRLLREHGALVVGIHRKPVAGETAANVIVGELQAVATLQAAGITEAHTLVIATSDDALNLSIMMQARVLNPQIRIINRFYNTNLGERLDQTLSNHLSLSVVGLAAPVFTFAALGNKAIGQIKLLEQTWPIQEEYIHENHAWKGRKISCLWEDPTRMLIYYVPIQGKMNVVSAVLLDQQLKVGDRLIIGTQPRIRPQRKSFIRKLIKAFANIREFQKHAQSVVGMAIALLVIILLSTFTYVASKHNLSFVDALYFAVGMITGAGGNDKVVENAPDSIKLFTVIIMLIGAVVIGLWYATLTDFILGSRLKQFLDAARIPQHNHYIVCGLSGIGIRIVQQLHLSGHEVVVIETDANNRYVTTARGMSIPVILADASFRATLQSSNINTATAVLAVTSNDATNLEIALKAKALAPNIPVIVNYADPDFAGIAQQVFDFEAVLSPAELAAPAFAAAALGGRIIGNGIIADNLWVAFATTITPIHPFCDEWVKDVAKLADFVPLYVEINHETVQGWDLLETILAPGDVLYLTMPANRLNQLWREEGKGIGV
ncbi:MULTISPECIES: TrkA family potassium uptake protein [Nostocales]|jgi:voltage-gated potassium channel Kch|uniref:potassium channel family protein n=1 Tax=Nostocales TaxID=1161 RepID=UPI00029B6485|nr:MULTISPECIES: NAD-binding protein [Nostocales]MBO1050465.1 potassium channel protein [Dolichospermum sp. DET73]AFW96669.1 TrkA domain-containing protein [Anabaena sp. 90]MTJ19372.1 potassium channel protein [Dolichospermum sp. UHCC 0299]MTJ20229.1 potassium channel protein [Dolichospermum sp. UHCC 0352]MTJ40650.1 potassium channel protein [Dolichospermum sp. UHCC 0406]